MSKETISELEFMKSEIKKQINIFKETLSLSDKEKCFKFIFYRYDCMCHWCYDKHNINKNGVNICKECEQKPYLIRVDMYIKKKMGGISHWINETLAKIEIV